MIRRFRRELLVVKFGEGVGIYRLIFRVRFSVFGF